MDLNFNWPVTHACYGKNDIGMLNLFLNGLGAEVIVCLTLCADKPISIKGDAFKKSINAIANHPNAVCYFGDVDLNYFNVITGKFRSNLFIFRKSALAHYNFYEIYSFLLYLCSAETIHIDGLAGDVLEYSVKSNIFSDYVKEAIRLNELHFGIVIPTKKELPLRINALENHRGHAWYLRNNGLDGDDKLHEYKVPMRIYAYDYDFNYSKIHNDFFNRGIYDKYCILMNDDIECDEDTLYELLCPFMFDSKMAVVGAKLYYPDGTIQHAGVRLDRRLTAYHVGRKKTDSEINDCFDTDCCVTFALVAIDVDKYKELGGMDEMLPYDFNDIDYCLRCKERGWTVLYNPQAKAIHRESETRKVDGVCGVSKDTAYFKNKHRGLFK